MRAVKKDMKTIIFDVDVETKAEIQEEAKRANMSVSAYVREKLINITDEDVQRIYISNEISYYDKKLDKVICRLKQALSRKQVRPPYIERLLRELDNYQEKLVEAVDKLVALEDIDKNVNDSRKP